MAQKSLSTISAYTRQLEEVLSKSIRRRNKVSGRVSIKPIETFFLLNTPRAPLWGLFVPLIQFLIKKSPRAPPHVRFTRLYRSNHPPAWCFYEVSEWVAIFYPHLVCSISTNLFLWASKDHTKSSDQVFI